MNTLARWTRTLTIVAVLAAGGAAKASAPLAAWSFPDEVTIVGADTDAPEVIVRGWFLVWSGSGPVGGEWGNQGFEEARYGRMYYRCKPGEKAMCTMQWGELQGYVGKEDCVGWGNQNETVGTLRADDGDLADPDPYPINQGVITGFTPCNHLAAAIEASPEPSVEAVPDLPPDIAPDVSPEAEVEPDVGPEPVPEAVPDSAPSLDTVPPPTDGTSATDATPQDDFSVAADSGAKPGKTADEDGCTSGGLGFLPGLLAAATLLASRRRRS